MARYIAESKLDKKREGDRTRPLFSDRFDDLTYRQANCLVSPDQDGPAKRDIIHLVISTTEEEYERLGEEEKERLDSLREIVREVAGEIEKELDVEKLHWFAGIHHNADNPHVHLAIGRDAVSLKTLEATRIKHLPRNLLPHKERQQDGLVNIQGKIFDQFTALLSRARSA